MKLFLIIAGILVLLFIFFRRYLITEKSISFANIFFKPRKFFHHHSDSHSHEMTVDEIIPSSENTDPKKQSKADSLVKRADIFLESGHIQTAEKALIQALSFDPGCIEAYKRLGILYLQQGQYGKAESIYRKLTLTLSDDPTFFSNLGLALFSQEKFEDAKKAYKRAIELDSKRAGRFFSLAQVLYELEEAEEALKHFQQAVSMEPENMDYLLTLGSFYADRSMANEAREILEQVLQKDPQNVVALSLLKKLGEENL